MALWRVEIIRTYEGIAYIDVPTREEAEDAGTEMVADITEHADPDTDVYVTAAGTAGTDDVYVGGERGEWLTAEEYDVYLAEKEENGPPKPIPGQRDFAGNEV